MPVYKSRVRFQRRIKNKHKKDNGRQAQRKPLKTSHVGDSESTLFEGVDEDIVEEGFMFSKKRVPSTDELGTLLRSELSFSLAAAKTSTDQKDRRQSPPTATSPLIEQQVDDDEGPPVSLLGLAPTHRAVNDRLEPTNRIAAVDEDENNEPPASLLATTGVSVPVEDSFEPDAQARATARSAIGSCAIEDEEDPPASLLAVADVFVPVDDQLVPVVQAPEASDTCAIDDNDDPPASLLVETRQSFIDYIKPAVQSLTIPLQPSKPRQTLLQKVVTLFAGRRRTCRSTTQEMPCSIFKPTETQHRSVTTTSGPTPPPLSAPVRASSDLGSTPTQSTTRKNLVGHPPVTISPPYRPLEERLHEPFIAPAREHRYTGTQFVAPDVFKPAKVQRGFTNPSSAPSTTSPLSPTLVTRRQNSTALLLDRDETAWGKWYTKKPTAEDLPFAKVSSVSQRLDGVTEQQAWDAHRAKVLGPKSRTASNKLSVQERKEIAEAVVQEKAARLRNHPGHCFGAVTGDVYPYQQGMCW